MNGRVYDYNLGRFLSVDPFIQAPGNSQSMNPYSYIMNNPLAGTDPSGYMAECGQQLGKGCGDDESKKERRDPRSGKGFGWETVWINPDMGNGANTSQSSKPEESVSPEAIGSQDKAEDNSSYTYNKSDCPEKDNENGLRYRELSGSEQEEVLKVLSREIEMTDKLIKNIREGDPDTMKAVHQWTGYYSSDKAEIGKLVKHLENISQQMKNWRSDTSLIRMAPISIIGRAYPGNVSRPVYLGLKYEYAAGTFIHEASHYYGGKHSYSYRGLSGARAIAGHARDFEFYEYDRDPRPQAANNSYVIEYLTTGRSAIE